MSALMHRSLLSSSAELVGYVLLSLVGLLTLLKKILLFRVIPPINLNLIGGGKNISTLPQS